MNDARRQIRSCARVEFAGDEWLFFPTVVSARRDHARHDRRRARQLVLRARRRVSRRARPGAGRTQQRRHRHCAGQARSARRLAQAAAGARARRAGGPYRDRSGSAADHADSSTTRRSAARFAQPDEQLRAAAMGPGESDRAPRGARAVGGRGGESGLRHLGQRAAHSARGRAARTRSRG